LNSGARCRPERIGKSYKHGKPVVSKQRKRSGDFQAHQLNVTEDDVNLIGLKLS